MQTVSLKEFITNGKFGSIQLGMEIDEVIKTLGEPTDKAVYDNGHAEIVYGWYEFFYEIKSGILHGIQNDHLSTLPNVKTGRVNNKKDICFQNDKFLIDIWFLKKNRFLTFSETISNLEKEKINYIVVKDSLGDNIIQFDSGVLLDFNDLSFYCYLDKVTEEYVYHESIIDESKKILNGIRYFNNDTLNCH